MNVVSLFLILAITMAARISAAAWNAAGHMIIAAVAYQQLPLEVRDRAAEILSHHPDAEKWKTAYDKGPKDIPFDAYVLMRASVWPDEIRRKGNPHDHPTWHYINYPLRPPNFPMEPPLPQKEDVQYGIERCREVLRDKRAAAEIKAVHLAWLLHLVQDLHQPLHATALVNVDYPNGDKGGNDFWVVANRAGISLHSFWDGLLGSSRNMRSLWNEAIRLRKEFLPDSIKELRKSTTPTEWALESRHAALEDAYLRGKLRGGTEKESAQRLPDGYTKRAKAVAEKRAVLAGMRTAEGLNDLFGPVTK